VSVLLDDTKPYQNAAATWQRGTNIFFHGKTLLPKYLAGSPTNLTKFYSENVTGIGAAHGANGQSG